MDIAQGIQRGSDLPNDPLYRRVLQAGEKLPNETRAEVVARGREAIAPLIEILENDEWGQSRGPEGYASIHAVEILVELSAVEAMQESSIDEA